MGAKSKASEQAASRQLLVKECDTTFWDTRLKMSRKVQNMRVKNVMDLVSVYVSL